MNKETHIIGNWKMNPETFKEALNIASNIDNNLPELKKVDIKVAPPFVFLRELIKKTNNIKWGSQDVFWEEKGAYTGEISISQLKSLGAEFVILGHSERREFLGEDNVAINNKVKVVLGRNVTAVLCVGESAEIKSRGERKVRNFIKKQLETGLEGASYNKNNLMVAYEPLWAISSGENNKPAKPKDVENVAKFIKKILADEEIPILYGGSVSSDNVGNFLKCGSINGVLAGSASLNAGEFIKMSKIAGKLML